MSGPRHRKRSPPRIQHWELDLARKVASAFRTSERPELEAVLTALLLELKVRRPAGVRRWKSYLAKALYNRASRWMRKSRTHEQRTQRLDEGTRNPEAALNEVLEQTSQKSDLEMSFSDAWKDLNSLDQLTCQVLLEEEGNHTAAALRLRIHRNTVRLRLKRIREVIERHGFSELEQD